MKTIEQILENKNEVLVAGHRGMCSFYPESTLLSFQKSLDEKVDMIEMDLNLTKDKQVVVIHDNTIDRTTNGTGYVRDYNLNDLQQLDAGTWFNKAFKGLKIPTLIEFCELLLPYPELLLNVEIKEKTHETVDLTMEILKKYKLFERSVFTCFDAEITGYMADTYGVKTQGFPKEHMQNFIEGKNGTYSKLYAIGLDMSELTPQFVQEFEAMHILPWSYCPDSDELVFQSLECGARLVTANNPKPALKIFREKGLHK